MVWFGSPTQEERMNDVSLITRRAIPAGCKVMGASGAGEKNRNGQRIPRGDVNTDNGTIVSTTTVILSVTGERVATVRRAVWAVYDPMGRRVGEYPYNDRPGADRAAGLLPPVGPHRGYVLKEIIG